VEADRVIGSARDAIRRHERTLYRILSVGVAAVLWYLVTGSQNPEVERVVSVELVVRNLPSDLQVVRAPTRVAVRIRGPRSIVMDLNPQAVVAAVNLTETEPGEYRLPVRVEVPAGVRVLNVQPEQADVILDAVVQRTIPVEAVLHGNSPQGVVVGPPEVRPPRVTVRGPRSIVQQIRRAIAPADLTGLQNTQVQIVRVRVVNEAGDELTGLAVRPQQVQVRLPVREVFLTRPVPVVPTLVGTPPQGMGVALLEIDPPFVTVAGPQDVVARLATLGTEPVNLGVIQGEVRRTVRVQVPEHVRIQGSGEVSVRVVVVPSPASRELDGVPVVVEGLRAGLEASVEPASVSVRVVGSKDAVEGLSPDTIRATVDASQLTGGGGRLPVRVQVPDGLWIVQVRPAQVILRLRRS
jgi:YbbR domain-containing protein